MELARLGRTGLQVSRLGLGTMNFGMEVSEVESHRILDAALEQGINFVDTADVYGLPQSPDMAMGNGLAETIIGNWLARTGRRDEIVLATKVYQPMGLGPNDRGLSAYHIRRACEASLRRLQTDHIDLYQMHHVDRATPWEEIWQAMEQLVREGKISYVGTSNFAAWQIAVGQGMAEQRHLLGLVTEQSLYNLTARTVELEVVPALQHLGIGLIPWSRLGRGLLGGALEKATSGRRAAPARRAEVERLRARLEAYEQLCHDLGHEPAAVALAWLLHQPVVPSVITGPRTLGQLTANLRTLDVTLDEEVLLGLDEIWPGPGGTAPEAYAW